MVCHSEGSSLQVLQEDHHLEAVIQQHGPTTASFYVGSSLDEGPSLGSPPKATPTGQIQASVEVHSPMGEAVTPDFRAELEEVEEVEEVLENGCVLAEECLTEMQPTEEAVPRAPSVSADGVRTDSQEEEEEQQEGVLVVEQQQPQQEEEEETQQEEEVVVEEEEEEEEEEVTQQEEEVVVEEEEEEEEAVAAAALEQQQQEVVENEVEEHGNGDAGEVVVVVVEEEEEEHVTGNGDSGEVVEQQEKEVEKKKEKEEEEEEQRVNGMDESGDHTEAVRGAGGLLDHVVSEQEEDDLERLLSSEELGVEPGSVSEEPLGRCVGPPDDRTEDGPPQDEQCGGGENGALDLETETSGETLHAVNDGSESGRCADEAVEEGHAPLDQRHVAQEDDLENSVNAEPQAEDTGSPVSLDGIDPAVDPEDSIQNVNGHSEESTAGMAPSTVAEDSRDCDSHRTTTHSADSLIMSEEGDARQAPDGALDLCPTPVGLGAGEAPERHATACVSPERVHGPGVCLSQQMVDDQG